jgi:uncharacterized integral membrane protein
MIDSNRPGRFPRQVKAGLALVLLALVVIFALQNSERVSVVFLVWQLTLPRIVIFTVFFLSGLVIGAGIANWKKLTKYK